MSEVRLRQHGSKSSKYESAVLTVPTYIVRLLNEAGFAKGARFRVELTEEGILYRPVHEDEPEQVDVPSWLQSKGPPRFPMQEDKR